MAACERWKIKPWEFAQLPHARQVKLLAWEEQRTVEMNDGAQ